jgi:hypothetical protein
MMRIGIVSLLTFLVAACGGPPPLTPATVSLRMRGGPADATVTIDDKVLGPLSYVGTRGVALPPGAHRVSVTAPGYFPHDMEVVAKEGSGPIALDVKLVPVPD